MEDIDLKGFGGAMHELGLLEKSLAQMERQEVLMLARLVHTHSKKKCAQCDQWEHKDGSAWWCGRCRVDGHDVQTNSVCSIDLDKVPF